MTREPRVEGERTNIALGSLLILISLLALSLLLRFQRGLLGLILTGILVILGFYWFKEIRKALKSERPRKDYLLEISEEDDVISLTAQIPGPEEHVSFEVLGKKILLRGGMGFSRVVKLPCKVRVLSSSYVNGILHIKLAKLDVLERKEKQQSY